MDGQSLCRICLGKGARFNIYEVKCLPSFDSIESMMNVLFSFKVHANDGLPTSLCKSCVTNIIASYEFKRLAEESNKKLLKRINRYTDQKTFVVLEETGSVMYVKVEPNAWEDVKVDLEHVGYSLVNVDDGLVPIGNSVNIEHNYQMKDNEAEQNQMKNNDIGHDYETKINEAVQNCQIEMDDADNDDETVMSGMDTTVNEDEQTDLVKKNQNKEPRTKEKYKSKPPTVCNICGKAVVDIHGHKKLHLPNRKLYPCASCPKVFLGNSGRRSHNQSAHLGMRYFCTICQKFYTSATQHKRVMHGENNTIFECEHCDKKFFIKGRLAVHMSQHYDYRMYPCKVCGKRYKTSIDANAHKRRVHDEDRRFVCHYCAKTFYRSDQLKDHIRFHNNDGYVCSECGKMFVYKAKLKRHQKIHEDKEFPCTLCTKQFHTAGKLNLHLISHSKEKKYPCKCCGIDFERSDLRNKHERTVQES